MRLPRLFRNRNFNRQLLSLALPITLQRLMLSLVAVADALMLGQVDQNSMAAVSLAVQFQFIQNIFLEAISNGVGMMGAQYWGKKDIAKIDDIFAISVRSSTLISLLFFLGCFLLPDKLMLLFAHDEELVEIGADYLRIASFSYLLVGITQSYHSIMRVTGQAAYSAWISSGIVLLNIFLNTILIFGLFGLPTIGVQGAALATVITRIVELFWCVFSSHGKGFIHLKLNRLFHFIFPLILDFWRYTIPILSGLLLWAVGFSAYTAIMGHLGATAAAANAVTTIIREPLCGICDGLAAGAEILIANQLGANNLKRGKIYGKKILRLGFIAGFLATISVLASIPVITSFVHLTEEAHSLMIGMFFILSVYMFGRCACTITINGTFTAGGDAMFDAYSMAVCMWGVAVPCAFLGAFVFKLPVLLVFACTCLDEIGKIPWVLHHYKKYKWVKNITKD